MKHSSTPLFASLCRRNRLPNKLPFSFVQSACVSLALLLSFFTSNLSAEVEAISKTQILEALQRYESFLDVARVLKIQAMDQPSRCKAVAVMVELIQEFLGTRKSQQQTDENFAANEEISYDSNLWEAKRLMAILPMIADDKTLATLLRPYAESADDPIREAAIQVLQTSRGSMVGKILEEQGAASFAKIPSWENVSRDEDARRKTGKDWQIFLLCIMGLLRSDSEQFRDAGFKYLDMLRAYYSQSEEMRAALPDFERQLKKELNRYGLPSRKGEIIQLPPATPAPGE